MAQDDDSFEPRLGRSRKNATRGPNTLSAQILPRLARAGGNPRKLRSVIPQAQPTRSGRFNARGRGAKIAATFPRGSGWSFDRASGMQVRPRRVTVKVRIVKPGGKAGGVQAHLRYLEREGVTREGEPGRLYSTFSNEVDRDAFIERGMDDRHQFRMILSPEDGAAYEDLKPFTRDVLAKMEADLETTLDWVAVDHHDTGHPHVHVVVRGITEDGKILNIAGDYISHGIRHRASEVLTRDLGHQTELEMRRQLGSEVGAERLTRLDRTLIGRVEDGVIDLRAATADSDFGRAHQQLLIARARRLERMGLAKADGPLRWSLTPETESTLRTMGERGDIIKAMHRAITQAKLDRAPEFYTIHNKERPPIVGRVIARGLADEHGDRRYLLIDGIDGRTHYADIGEQEGSFAKGSVVHLSNRSAAPRQVDRTVAEVAAANDGRYSVDIHLAHDRTAQQTFAETHVRRLEAIRKATRAVERETDGTWIVKPDYLDRVRQYEERIAEARPMVIETLSSIPLGQQIGREGATWIDRQLVRQLDHNPARYGFGKEVQEALAGRQQWLVDKGLARDEGSRVVFPGNLLKTLEQRELRHTGVELSRQLGKEFVPPVPGVRVEGVVKQMLQLASGPFALIEKSLEFTLVPWGPCWSGKIGRNVSGISRGGDDYDWSFGRGRGGPSR